MAYERRDFAGAAVSTNLTAGISDSATSFTITSATGWPDGGVGAFYARIGSETIRCSSRSGTTVQVAVSGRGADGTTAAAHTTSESVTHVASSVDLDEANEAVYEVLGDGSSWSTWTPTWTNLTVGNGTESPKYHELGKLVTVQGILLWGGTTAITGSGIRVSLPVESSVGGSFGAIGQTTYWDASASTYYRGWCAAMGSDLHLLQAAASSGVVTSTSPFTWTSSDAIYYAITYEAA